MFIITELPGSLDRQSLRFRPEMDSAFPDDAPTDLLWTGARAALTG